LGEGDNPIVNSTMGSAPYTKAQAAPAALQGVAAPVLTETTFGRSYLNGAAQLLTVVTQTMPLTAPGSLKGTSARRLWRIS
jgi:hypothetical protein